MIHDVPADSLRQRIARLVTEVESGRFGKSDVESLVPELRGALNQPDFAVHQQTRLAALLDELRFSGGLHRSRAHVMFPDDLIDWLEGYRNVLADISDKNIARHETAVKRAGAAVREADALRGQVAALTAQRDAVRNFFTGQGDDDG